MTLFTKSDRVHKRSAFSSLLPTLYVENVWDHDPVFGDHEKTIYTLFLHFAFCLHSKTWCFLRKPNCSSLLNLLTNVSENSHQDPSLRHISFKAHNIYCPRSLIRGQKDPGAYSQKNWVGVCGPLPKTLTLFMIKICDIPYSFYDLSYL